MRTKKSRYRGSAVIPFLFLLSLSSLIFLRTFLYAYRTGKIIAAEVTGRPARAVAAARSVLDLNPELPSVPEEISCHKLGPGSDAPIRTKSLCILNTDAYINFNLLAALSEQCDTPSDFNGNLSGFETTLSEDSVRWPVTCGKKIPPPLKRLVTLSNLEIAEDIETAGQPPENSTLIAAFGYTDINSVLTVRNDTVIVSGGDIRINRISIESPANPVITVISGTGFVKIGAIEGRCSLYYKGGPGSYIAGNGQVTLLKSVPAVSGGIIIPHGEIAGIISEL